MSNITADHSFDTTGKLRSSGWMPLAYPAQALFSPRNWNEYFPLHYNVLLAFTRECCLLQGVLDPMTLRILKHNSISGNSKNSGNFKKRKAPYPISSMIGNCQHTDADEETAEQLVQKWIQAAMLSNGKRKHRVEDSDDQITIRKVSDAAETLVISCDSTLPFVSNHTPHIALCATNIYPDCLDAVGRFCSQYESSSQALYAACTNPSISMQGTKLLQVSILIESQFRDLSYDMIHRLLCHAPTSILEHLELQGTYPWIRALRSFFGYKSAVMKHDRLIRLLSDYLFDVSHAYYGWEQTEREMKLPSDWMDGCDKSLTTFARISDTLFDSRALKVIGGVEPHSILTHSLSIRHCGVVNMSWSAFAATAVGKKMLRHHLDKDTLAKIGVDRRGVQKRNYLVHSRPRALSVTSSSEGSCSASLDESDPDQRHCGLENADDASFRNELNIVIERLSSTCKWGIALSNENSMCVVVQAPPGVDAERELQVGDLILSVQNDRNEIAFTPSSSRMTRSLPGALGVPHMSDSWFADIVKLFKESCKLSLEIRRVQTILQITPR